jgi:hypothetical protein
MNKVLRMTPSFENRRRAIYTALIEHLSGDELWDAIARWEDAYAHDPSFSGNRFLSDVLASPELRARRSRILQSLIKALSAPPHTLLPDPREQLQAYRMTRGRAVSTSAVSRDPLVAACASLLTRLLRNLDDDGRLRMRLFILENVERGAMPTATRDAIRHWMNEQTRLMLDRADRKDLQRLVNLAYIALCEYLGPVKADAALGNALRQLGEEEADLLPYTRELL